MRPSVLASVALLFFALPSLSHQVASQSAPQTVSTAVRDPQALALLTQCINAAGGLQGVVAINDYTATGNITFFWPDGPVQGMVTIKGRGLHEFRLDATLPDGLHSSVVNGTGSFLNNPDGSVSRMPPQNAAKISGAMFPLVAVLNAVQDESVSVSDGGLVSREGQQSHDIVIQRVLPAERDPDGSLGKITKAHILIDPQSLEVQSVEDSAYPRDILPGQTTHEIRFSAYQSVKSIVVPFSIVEFIGGQQVSSITLTQITFNNNLSDADFN